MTNESKMKKLIIGIDPGMKTGVAVWDVNNQMWNGLFTCDIFKFDEHVEHWAKMPDLQTFFIIENPEWMKRPRNMTPEQWNKRAQGAGSVKTSARLILKTLQRHKMKYKLTRASKSVKMEKSLWNQVFKYNGQSSSHARDAAIYVFKTTILQFDLLCKNYDHSKNRKSNH